MSRRSPTGFVFSVAAEVIAVVFIVSVLPRVDLRRTADAALNRDPASESAATPLQLPQWGQTVDRQASEQTHVQPHETSYYQRRTQPELARETSRERDITPLIAVDPAKPGYVEQRLDRASQDLVNSVGSYVSEAAADLLQVQPPPVGPQRPGQPVQSGASQLPRYSSSIPPLPPSFPATAPAAGSFPTQPLTFGPAATPGSAQPRPWMRY
jgi:hypothetical protein